MHLFILLKVYKLIGILKIVSFFRFVRFLDLQLCVYCVCRHNIVFVFFFCYAYVYSYVVVKIKQYYCYYCCKIYATQSSGAASVFDILRVVEKESRRSRFPRSRIAFLHNRASGARGFKVVEPARRVVRVPVVRKQLAGAHAMVSDVIHSRCWAPSRRRKNCHNNNNNIIYTYL